MKRRLTLIFITMLTISGNALACPMCIGNNQNDKYYLWIIGIFILVIYFPMFYLFKTFMKFKNVNNIENSK